MRFLEVDDHQSNIKKARTLKQAAETHRVERAEAEVRFLEVDDHRLGAVRLLRRQLRAQLVLLRQGRKCGQSA